MSVELQNIVSKMMADSVPEEQIAAVIQQYKQAPPQPEVEQPGKAQTPQKDVTVESQEDMASTSENSLLESQYKSSLETPEKVKSKFELDKDVSSMIRSYDLSDEETQSIISQVDAEYTDAVKEFELLDKDVESAESASKQKIGTRSKHDAQYLPSPTGGGGIWVWPDGYQETDFGFTIPDLNTGEEISTDTQTTTDLKKDQYLSNTAKNLKPLFEQARRNLKNGDTLPYDDPKLVAQVKKLRREQLEQNHMDDKIEDQMEFLADTQAQLKYGPGPVSSIIGGTLKSDVQKKLYEDAKIAKEGLDKKTKYLVDKTQLTNKAVNDIRSRLVTITADDYLSKENNRILAIDAEMQKIADGEYTSQEQVDEAQAKINLLNSERTSLTQKFIDARAEYDDLKNKEKLHIANAVELNKQAVELGETDQELTQYLDAIGRNYGWVTQAGAAVFNSINTNLAGVIKYAGESEKGVLEWAHDKVPDIYKPVLAANIWKTNKFIDLADNMMDLSESISHRVEKPKSLDEIDNFFDMADWATHSTLSQTGTILALTCLGPAGLPVLGMSSAGNTWREMDKEEEFYANQPEFFANGQRNPMYNFKYSWGQQFLTCTATGLAETLSERITYGQLNGVSRTLKGNAKRGFTSYIKKNFMTTPGLLKNIYDPMYESGTEMAAEFGGNLAKKYFSGNPDALKNQSLLEGLPEAGVSGLWMSGIVFKAPVAGQAMLNGFQTSESAGQLKQISLDALEIMSELNNENLSPENRANFESQLRGKIQDYNIQLTRDINNIDQMTKQEVSDLMLLDVEKHSIQQRITDIQRDNSILPESKEKMIEDLNNRASEISAIKNDIISPYNAEWNAEEIKSSIDQLEKKTRKIFGDAVEVERANNDNVGELFDEFRLQQVADLTTELNTMEKQEGESDQEFDNRKYQVNQAIQDIQNASAVDPRYSHGFILQDPSTGRQRIVINTDYAAQKGATNVAAHEFLHAVLYNTMKDNPQAAKVMGEALNAELMKIDATQVKQSRMANRIQAYQDAPDNVRGEEALALFSDAIETGDIVFKESAMDKVGGTIRRIAQATGIKDIQFNDGRDVYNFVKDFNKSFKSGLGNRAIAKGAKSGFKLGGKLLEQSVKNNVKVELSKPNRGKESRDDIGPDVNRAYDTYKNNWNKGGADAAINDIFKPGSKTLVGFTNLINARVTSDPTLLPPGFSAEDFVAGTIVELIPHIRNFNKDFHDGVEGAVENDNLFAWVNSYLGRKAAGVLGSGDAGTTAAFGTSLDADDSFTQVEGDLDADVLVNEDLIETSEDIGTPLLDNIKVNQDQLTALTDAMTRIIGTRLPAVDTQVSKNKFTTPLISELKKQFGVKNGPMHQIIKEIMGNNLTDVDAFLTNPKTRTALLNGLTTTYLSKNLPKAVEKSVGGTRVANPDNNGETNIFTPKFIKDWQGAKIDRHNAKDEGPYRGVTSGPQVMRRNPDMETDITPADMRRRFLKGNTLSDARRGGLESLELAFAQELGLEIFKNDLQTQGPLSQVFEGRQELFDRALAENYAEEIARQMNRGTAKFSKDRLTEQEVIKGVNDLTKDLIQNFQKDKDFGGVEDLVGKYPQQVIDAFADKGIIDMFDGNVKANFTTPTKAKFEEIAGVAPEAAELYLTNSSQSKAMKDAMAEVSMELIDALPPEILNAVGKEFFGLTSKRLLDGAVKKDGSLGPYNYVAEKLNESKSKKSKGETLPFDPNAIEVLNPGTGLMSAIINNVLNKTGRQAKLKALEGYQDRIDNANNNNKKFMAYTAVKFTEMAFKNPKLLAGIAGHLQGATNNAKGPRGYTGLGAIKVTDKSQAPYLTEKGNPTTTNTGIVNTNHPDYARAVEFAKVTGLDPVVYLKYKGEHMDPNAPIMAKMFDIIADGVVSMSQLDGNALAQQQILDNVYQDVLEATKSWDQSLNTKLDSDIQDDRLTSTSQAGYFRNYAVADQLSLYVDDTGAPLVDKIVSLSGELIRNNVARKEAVIGNVIDQALENGRTGFKQSKGISILDFDDTLATTKSNVLFTAPDGSKGKLNAEEFASQGADLLEQGYIFDFSEFNKVVGGKTAPLFNKALKLAEKFGTNDMFVLTARPPQAQQAIFEFLKANGLNIPLKNITGLGNSTSEAKALWVANKFAEGYNDFYFADDALQNVQAVQNMLDQFDVKSKVQQAKLKFSKDMSARFNGILEATKGVEAFKKFSEATARKRGQNIGRYNIFIPPSAEDFKGLLYSFLSKGKKGEQQLEFFNEALLKPFARADREINTAKQRVSEDYRALKKEFPNVKKKLGTVMEGTDFTWDTGARVYLWNKNGIDIPGISKTDLKSILQAFKKDPEAVMFADALGVVSKQKEGYVQPDENWVAETIASDLDNVTNKIGRKRFLAEFIENRAAIFGDWKGGKLVGDNMNKIEAIYGSRFREALNDIIWRMENGTNRAFGSGRLVNAFSNWVNNSVGAIMFLNARSAVLQTLSTANFINWNDNNPAKAALAFANQPQFWKDFSMIFNSDMLKQRRRGLKTDVNQAELANAVAGSKNKAKAAFAYLIKIGFTPTQIADSFAIASGGATFYRNRVKTYLKDGLSQTEAEQAAFLDFQQIAEETQQSSRPDLISQQQASPLGRLVLAFQNTPMQYARLTKKAVLDLANGRGDAKANISKILYYGAVQNLIFSSLQKALFSVAFDDEEDDDAKSKQLEKEGLSILNSMSDSLLRGMGIGGAAVSTLKNMLIKFMEENDKGWNADFDKVTLEFLNLSPPIGSKARKLTSAGKGYQFNKDVIKEMNKLDINNPMWYSIGNTVSALTNVPLDRVVNKVNNIKEALDARNEGWQRIALLTGWNSWDLGVEKEEVQEAKQKIKERKKAEKEAKKKAKQKDKPVKKRCAAKTTDGSRCKVKTSNKSGLCHFHD